MLKTDSAKLAIKVLIVILCAAISFVFAADAVSRTQLISDTLQSLEKSNSTILAFSAAALGTAIAISAIPGDFGSPLADKIADLNDYLLLLLVVVFVERLIVVNGISIAFKILIPAACILVGLFFATKKELLKSIAVKLVILAIAISLVIPFSSWIVKTVCSEYTDYVEVTIDETKDCTDKFNQEAENESDEASLFDKLASTLKVVGSSLAGVLDTFKQMIGKLSNALAILVVTTFVIPIAAFLILLFILKQLFSLNLSVSSVIIVKDKMRHKRHAAHDGVKNIGNKPGKEVSANVEKNNP